MVKNVEQICFGSLVSYLTKDKKFENWSYQSRVVSNLPQSVKILKFGHTFNEPIELGVLPRSLEELEFHGKFNQPLAVGLLPSNLKKLTLYGGFNQPLPIGSLPTSLKYLSALTEKKKRTQQNKKKAK